MPGETSLDEGGGWGAGVRDGMAVRRARGGVLRIEIVVGGLMIHERERERDRSATALRGVLKRYPPTERESTYDSLLWPEWRSEDGGDETKSGTSRSGRTLGDDLLDVPLVFCRLSVVERRLLDNDAARKPADELRADEALTDVEIDLIRQPMGENLVDIGGHICRSDGRDMCWSGRGEGEGKRGAAAFFGGEDEGVLDSTTGPHEEVSVLELLDERVVWEGSDGGEAGKVASDVVDGRSPASGREWGVGGEEVASGEEAGVKELVLSEREVFEEGGFGDEGHRRGGEVDGEDELVELVGVEEGFGRGVDGVDEPFRVFLEVDKLSRETKGKGVKGDRGKERRKEGRTHARKCELTCLSHPSDTNLLNNTHLSWSKIGSDDELYAPVPKDPEHEPEEIPLFRPSNALQDPNRLLDPPILIVLPSLLLHRTLPRRIDPSYTPSPASSFRRSSARRLPRQRQAGADKDGLDMKLLERAEVGFDEGCEGERESAGGRDEGLARVGRGEEGAKVLGEVDPEPGVREGGEGTGLDQLPVGEVGWSRKRRERWVLACLASTEGKGRWTGAERGR
jgi:hypothetical protein